MAATIFADKAIYAVLRNGKIHVRQNVLVAKVLAQSDYAEHIH